MFTKHRYTLAVWMLLILLLFSGFGIAENVDPNNDNSQYAWGENVGWFNFEPSGGSGVTAHGGYLDGFVWGENVGWISLSCQNTSSCGTVSYEVVYDGSGNLSGYGWGENVGWVNFGATGGNAAIDDAGNFTGYAWGENIGWISLDTTMSNLRVCGRVDFVDLKSFAADWLDTGSSWDLDADSDDVDFEDFAIFASSWLDFCVW